MTILDALESVLEFAMDIDPDNDEAIRVVDEWLSEYRKLGPTPEEWAGAAEGYQWFAIDGYMGTPKQTAFFCLKKPHFDADANCWWTSDEDGEMDFYEVEPREVPENIHVGLLLWERPA